MKITMGVVAVLVLLRLALPHVIKHVINEQLANMDGYRGRVDDVDVALWRGAYALDGLLIEQIDGDQPVPFVDIETVDISIAWAALLQGEVVAELVLTHPILNFVGGTNSQNGKGNDWRETVDGLVPVTINHLRIRNGELHYRDFSTSPQVDLVAREMEAEVTGLSTNPGEDGERQPADLDLHATVQHSGELTLTGTLNPWEEHPTFDMNLTLERLAVRQLNPFLRAYAGVDAEEGRFFLYSELHASGGRFRGYVKPMIEGLSVFRFGEDGDLLDQLGDLAAQIVQDVFENPGTDRFATQVTLSGSFDAPGVDPIEALVGILSNAFIRAVTHGLNHPQDWEAEPRHRGSNQASVDG